MSSDPKHTRRRTNSAALSLGRQRGISRVVHQPKSSHTADEFLHPFLNPSFDPASFLNTSLPPLQQRTTAPTSSSSSTSSASASGLADLSSQAQTLISQLNAHTTRLSATLTSLTDDILRSGSRLAYEVELLRGETIGLTDAFEESLSQDIKALLPDGLVLPPTSSSTQTPAVDQTTTTTPAISDPTNDDNKDDIETDDQPLYIKQLQTLTTVRFRLDSVIKTFGDAMEFPFPPSELSVSSSFLSVSAPSPGDTTHQSSEEKGQKTLQALRDEVASLLSSSSSSAPSSSNTNDADPVEAIAAAAQRVEQLKELTKVWKGTCEENGRAKFIDGLAKMVEDRHRELMREIEGAGKRNDTRPGKGSSARDTSMASAAAVNSNTTTAAAAAEDTKGLPGGFGLLSQLQRLRTGI